MEYDTGMLVELEPNSRWFVSFYVATAEKTLDEIIKKLDDVGASPGQLQKAAQRCLASVQLIDLESLPLKELTAGAGPAGELLLECQQALAEPSLWETQQSAKRTLVKLLRELEHMVLLTGSRLPREYAIGAYLQSVRIGFTDDSDEEQESLQKLKAYLQNSPKSTSKTSESEYLILIEQTSHIVQELINFTPSVRDLILEILQQSVKSFGNAIPAHARASMHLLTRISQDLDGIRILVHAERPEQALTLAAALFEFAYYIGYIGTDDTRAERWLNLRDDERFKHDDGGVLEVRDLIGITHLNYFSEVSQIERRREVEALYKQYKFLCGFKHGHPQNIQRGTSKVSPESRVMFTPDPKQNYYETWLTLVAMYEGLFTALNTGIVCHLEFSYESPNIRKSTHDLLDHLIRIDKQHTVLENSVRIDLLPSY